MQRIDRFNNLDQATFYIGKCLLNENEKKIARKNPHCLEYFCTLNKISNCSTCMNHLSKLKIELYNKNLFHKYLSVKNINKKKNEEYCKKHCSDGFFYNYIKESTELEKDVNIVSNHKDISTFKTKKLVLKYEDIPYKFDYVGSFPLPKTIIHWGQLKMFCVTLFFLIKVINSSDEKVDIVYAGSARGDNILLLCKMFPNTNWYLIDPREHLSILNTKKEHKDQIQEIITDYFTDKTAEYYHNKFKDRKNKLLFLSDIREGTDDDKIIQDQEQNARWHKIIKPDYSYFKFRCPYENVTVNGKKTNLYNYYKGGIYLQIYAPMSSTETRILFKTKLESCQYNIDEYTGKMSYFNRILRPSYYKSIIPDTYYFDHCYDCVYYAQLINLYYRKFKSINPFNISSNNKILKTMRYITNYISRKTLDKIKEHNLYTRNNIK